jgi:hypothetical protein
MFVILASNTTIFHGKSSGAVEGFPNSFTNGQYWNEIPGEMSVEIKGRKYKYSDETGQDTWNSITKLTYIRKDVFILSTSNTQYYFCLSNPKLLKGNNYSLCTAKRCDCGGGELTHLIIKESGKVIVEERVIHDRGGYLLLP